MNLQSTNNLGSLKVLVADDYPDNLDFMLMLLKDIVQQVDVVCDGQAALHKLETNNYDIVIMDYHMPNMDGCEATRILREREGQQQHTAVIGLTADSNRGIREMFFAAGMDDFMTKPVMIKDLLTMMMKVAN